MRVWTIRTSDDFTARSSMWETRGDGDENWVKPRISRNPKPISMIPVHLSFGSSWLCRSFQMWTDENWRTYTRQNIIDTHRIRPLGTFYGSLPDKFSCPWNLEASIIRESHRDSPRRVFVMAEQDTVPISHEFQVDCQIWQTTKHN
jgi:hypothetical protein